ncbi:hypothetical protein AVEN_176656-1 [Araneus ventricosus]|uniref:Uncharacterized protein n=1 Tax=Araneus ventricosus TaxID=182803 RepID=A0A4Y2WEN8_ARAVE|nr:hypothetical protein AVEN_176656-1 [Araneus ventricosus]
MSPACLLHNENTLENLSTFAFINKTSNDGAKFAFDKRKYFEKFLRRFYLPKQISKCLPFMDLLQTTWIKLLQRARRLPALHTTSPTNLNKDICEFQYFGFLAKHICTTSEEPTIHQATWSSFRRFEVSTAGDCGRRGAAPVPRIQLRRGLSCSYMPGSARMMR